MPKSWAIFPILFSLAGCSEPAAKRLAGQEYFDLKAYIQQEATRLSGKNPIVSKTVIVNGLVENKKVRIADWSAELTSFSDADINKAAWKGLFHVVKNDTLESYQSDDNKVNVKRLEIVRKNGRIRQVEIVLKTTNYLYTSTDQLTYYPDSIYRIEKNQQIRLLQPKSYKVTGEIK